MLVVGLFALREQKPLMDMMVDEVPGQDFVVAVMAGHEEIGIGKAAPFSPRHFAFYRTKLMPDSAGIFDSGGGEAFEN